LPPRLSRRSLGEGGSLKIAVQRGYSFVGVFNRRLDEIFVGVLRKWDATWRARHAAPKRRWILTTPIAAWRKSYADFALPFARQMRQARIHSAEVGM
jgi:hypothetical protein